MATADETRSAPIPRAMARRIFGLIVTPQRQSFDAIVVAPRV